MKIENLLEQCEPQEQVELKILHNATIECAKKYKKDPTAANRRNWETAKNALAETVEVLALKYEMDPEPGAVEKKGFKGLADVHRWLLDQGYTCPRATFYRQAKTMLKKYGGVYTMRAVEAYAKTLPRTDSGQTKKEAETGDLHQKKIKAEADLAEVKTQREKIKLDKDLNRFMPRKDHHQELAARFLVMKSDLHYLAKAKAGEMVHLVRGDISRANELTQFLLAAIDTALNNYASTQKYHVMIMPEKGESHVDPA
jgi:hypothetical protein